MSIPVDVGDPIRLRLQLFNGASTLFPRAAIYDEAGASVTGSPFALTHLAGGLYENDAFIPLLAGQYDASYVVYTDAAFTIESSLYARALDVFTVGGSAGGSGAEVLTAIIFSDETLTATLECED